MKKNSFKKKISKECFFKVIFIFTVMTTCLIFGFHIYHKMRANSISKSVVSDRNRSEAPIEKKDFQLEAENLKYILMWTYNHTYPFIYLKSGTVAFVEEKCEYTNCYVTNDRRYLSKLTDWDAIIFHAPEFTWRYKVANHGFPTERAPHQKYVFTCIESAHNYPSCDKRFDGYFNWTWTYKVDADVKWNYMGIRDIESGKIIGPAEHIDWKGSPDDEVSEDLKRKLKTKKKAAAWFVSNCHTKSGREAFVRKLEESLKKYDLSIDIYGRCGRLKCERDADECWNMIETDYYFYLSLENSFSEDYVTEKFLHAMKHRAVPIVWGGADYSRFAPPGSYLDARKTSPDELAQTMRSLMDDPEAYAAYFKWTKYYQYQRDIETPDTHAFCNMCRALNDPALMSARTSYENFNEWWSGDVKSC